MMVTTALDRLNTQRVAVIGRNGSLPNRRQVQILGSFTELNRTVQSNALSGESILPGGIKLELGADKNANHIALDLAMSEQNRIIPKTATSVSVQINGSSGDATITYDEGADFAAIGALGFTGQEGFHSGQRLLIETSVALMMSKYFHVDIRPCLQSSRKEVPPPIVSNYDEPIFDHAQAAKDDAKNIAIAPQTIATPPQPLPLQQPPTTYPGQTKPEMSDTYRLNIHHYNDGYSQNTPTKLPQENGVIVLPTKDGPKYLMAQPPEYNEKRNQSFSGVPEKNIADPAENIQEEFLNETDMQQSSSSYKQTF